MENFNNTFCFALSAVLLLVFSLYIVKVLSSRCALPNSDRLKRKKRYHPVAGTMLNQLLNFSRLWDYMADHASKYKTYRILTPFRSEVYTSDPANVEYILKTNFQNYGKGWYNYNNLKDIFGDGIFAVDGDKWRHQRKTSNYEFSTRVLRDFSTVVFQKNAAKLARIVSENANTSLPIDIQDLFLKSTLDSIFQVGFGTQLDSMCGSSAEGTLFANAFDDSSEMTARRYVDASWMIKRFLNIGSEAILKKNVQVIDEFVYKLIHTKMDQMTISPNDSSVKKDDILSRFLASNVTDPKYLRDIILNFMMAGRDTTAITLSWFLYMLCKHPHVQETVAQEVWEATNAKDNISFEQFASSVTEKALQKMHYLHAAITETLRLHPAVPMDPKICFSDDTLPDGFDVKKGDVVAYVPYAMGRMKFIWGDDAEVFRPERWLNNEGMFQNVSAFKFTAFQAGPRICLGRDFAYTQIKVFSAILLRFFSFKLADQAKDVKYRAMMTLHVDGGLHIQAFHRIG